MKKLLNDSVYFNKLNEQDLTAILRCFKATVKTYKKGEAIVRQGSLALNCYIVLDGQIKSTIIDENGFETLDNIYNKDDIFGLLYIRDDESYYQEDVIATKPSTILICDGFRFLHPCENRCPRHILLNKTTFKYYNKECELKLKRIYFMSKTHTKDKILAYLKSFNIYNEYFTIPYSKILLAQFLGVERSSLSTVLNDLKKKGIIDFINNSYLIYKK